MPLCGFNKKMLDGLSQFADGLYEQAIKRSQEDHLSLEESFKQEISEMDIFRTILKSKSDSTQVLMGITLVAQGLYKNGVGDSSEERIRKMFFDGVQKEKNFCVALDNEYYEVLRPKYGPVQALHELGTWIDSKKEQVVSDEV